MTDREVGFVIVGWREPDGRFVVGASEQLAAKTILDRSIEQEAQVNERVRLHMVDRQVAFRVAGTVEVAETDGQSFVPALIGLLQRWLPTEHLPPIEVEEGP